MCAEHLRGRLQIKEGVFEEAEGGTCFLDEIGDINLNMQAKLLRVLQEHEVRRVGGKDWIKVDVRVVAATHRDLAERVREGTFRQDLYYRLNVIAIHLPPLRERAEDIPLLARHFLKRYREQSGKFITAISDRGMELLRAYSWPGNIRELENAMEQAVVLSNQPVLTPDDFPAAIRDNAASTSIHCFHQNGHFLFPNTATLEEVKKRYVLHVLSRNQRNISCTARVLNIDRRSLYRMLARYKIEPFHKDE
jgi:DNA-binding NtrC family response regulator